MLRCKTEARFECAALDCQGSTSFCCKQGNQISCQKTAFDYDGDPLPGIASDNVYPVCCDRGAGPEYAGSSSECMP